MSYKSKYKTKRKGNRGDYYGEWLNGKQITSERVNGRTLSFDAVRHNWK